MTTTHPRFVSYIDKSREYYQAQGYRPLPLGHGSHRALCPLAWAAEVATPGLDHHRRSRAPIRGSGRKQIYVATVSVWDPLPHGNGGTSADATHMMTRETILRPRGRGRRRRQGRAG